ncbi:MAG: M20/M25/M40 family metallo-hydrolase, partial [Gemmatimonadales bacterium]
MASTWPTEVQLLRDLVAVPSVSGAEEAAARLVEDTARGWGLSVHRDDASVTISLQAASPGPTLALVSHLDVVPAGEGWTRDPFSPTVEGERLYGRGSGDAKASVAAMTLAARDLAQRGGPARGRLVVILGYGEETKLTSMGRALASAGRVDAAVVGEPTNLDFAIAQRGLMMVDLVARGEQHHAAHPAEDGAANNSILHLARELGKLDGLFQERRHPVLGFATATPTMLEGGISRNVTPPVARAVLDVRSTPSWTHAELAAELRRALSLEVVVTSDRLVPCETPPGSLLLDLASGLRPSARRFGSPTCSDWVFLRECDAIKCCILKRRRSQ